jgi:hypothetical protein
VVEDEDLFGVLVDELDRRFQVLFEDQNVVAEIVFRELFDAFVEGGAEDEVVVGFVLDDVADALELLVFGEAFEVLVAVLVAEVDPADDAFEEVVLFGVGEEIVGLLDGLAGLDGDGAIDAGGFELLVEVGREEVPADDLHLLADPAVFRVGVLPEVVVGVDDGHGLGELVDFGRLVRGEAPTIILLHPEVDEHDFVVEDAGLVGADDANVGEGDGGILVYVDDGLVLFEGFVDLAALLDFGDVRGFGVDDAGGVGVDEVVGEEIVEGGGVAFDDSVAPLFVEGEDGGLVLG